MFRISNTSWAYGTTDQLWVGQEDFLTAQQKDEMLAWEEEVRLEEHIARHYGDCGRPITGTGDYEQLLHEEHGAYPRPFPYGY